MRARSALGLAFVPVACSALVGCGGATPAAQSASDVAVVNVEGGQRAKGEEGTKGAVGSKTSTNEKSAREKALEGARQAGVLGALRAIDVAELTNVLGGAGSAGFGAGGLGAGGLGLSGIGAGGGGVAGGVVGGVIGSGGGGGGGGGAIGFGSIGTMGFGSGRGAGSYAPNPVPGQSVHVSGGMVIELGDSVTLGVSVEQCTRALRDRVHAMRACYEKGLDGNAALAGAIAMRLVVDAGGHVDAASDIGSTLADRATIDCVLKSMDDAYMGVPPAGSFGVVETVIRFSPKKP